MRIVAKKDPNEPGGIRILSDDGVDLTHEFMAKNIQISILPNMLTQVVFTVSCHVDVEVAKEHATVIFEDDDPLGFPTLKRKGEEGEEKEDLGGHS